VQNYFSIETEVAHRRFEYERELAATIQVAPTRPERGGQYWSPLAHRLLTSLRSRVASWVPGPSWQATGEPCALTLEGGRATVM
jgi:hypothetical protein